jgi:hypothetical protein
MKNSLQVLTKGFEQTEEIANELEKKSIDISSFMIRKKMGEVN